MRLLQTRVMQPWNPHLTIDCHATNGSIHRFALTYDIPHTLLSGRDEPIEFMREQLLPAVTAAVKANDGLDTFYYGNFLRDEGGQGIGWITYTHHPRFGGNYRGLCNRLDLLLETYAYISFAERVRATYAFVRETLAFTRRACFADRRAARQLRDAARRDRGALPPRGVRRPRGRGAHARTVHAGG